MTANSKSYAFKRHRIFLSYGDIQADRELRLSKVYTKFAETEKRLDRHEADISSIKDKLNTLIMDVEIIKSNYATKADLANLKTELKVDIADVKREVLSELSNAMMTQTRWMVGLMFVAIGLVFSIQPQYAPHYAAKPVLSTADHMPLNKA